MKSEQSSATSASPRETNKRKPLRFKVGIGLLVLYPLMWLFAAVVPFLGLSAATKAAVVTGDLIAAECIGLLGIALVGKESYQAIKTRLLKRKQQDHEEGRLVDNDRADESGRN